MNKKELDNLALEKIRLGWEAYSGQSLTLEDAREINFNLLGFFKLLDKWDREGVINKKSLLK